MIKDKKTDHRSRYTQMIIRKSLLKLLSQKKSLNTITATELCREAEVTRSTFYNHFCDIYDVYESIEDEFFYEVQNRLEKVKAYAIDETFFKEIMRFVAENSEFMTFITADLGKNSLLNKIIIHVRAKYVSEFCALYPNISSEFIEKMFTFTLNGSIGILVDWVEQGMSQPSDQIADYIRMFTSEIVQNLLSSVN